MGISWGGFNGLQVAALKPPALKAVISIASTVDRYNDDIHYKDGCHLSAQLSWAATMLAYQSRPPDPALVGERWRRHVAGAARGRAVHARGVAVAPAPRRLLAPRLDLRGLRRLRRAGARHRRLGRRLPQHAVQGSGGRRAGASRPWSAHGSTSTRTSPGRSRAGTSTPRRSAGGTAGCATSRTAPTPCRRCAPTSSTARARALARRTTPATGSPSIAGPRPTARTFSVDAAGRLTEGAGRPAPARRSAFAARYRHRLRRVVHPQARRRDGRRPAPRRRRLAGLRHRAAAEAARAPRPARARARAHLSPRRSRTSSPASSTSIPTARRPASRSACSTSPTATATPSRRRSSPAREPACA